MKVLITGIAGFIGSHMAELLILKGYEVEGIDNFNDYYSTKLKRINAEELIKKGIRIYDRDLNDADLYYTLPLDYNFIIHFAAQPGIASSSSFETYLENNFIATKNILSFSKKQKDLKLFINIATSSIYGKFATQIEEASAAPTSHYGVTKLAGEQLVLAENRLGNINVCSLRLYSVYGPRERPDKMYTKLIRSAIFNEKFPLIKGSLSHKRNFSYSVDIMEGIFLATLKFQKCSEGIINFGCSIQTTTQKGVHTVEFLLNKKITFNFFPPRKVEPQETIAIINKAKKILGFEPKNSLTEGLKNEMNWHKNTIGSYGRL